MISIENLTFGYDASSPIIQSLDLNLESGKVHGIIGLNGSGKTTMLRLLNKEMEVDEGTISLGEGVKLGKDSVLLETESFFYSKMTGEEYLGFFKKQNLDFNIEEYNQLFHLPLKKLVENYSTGMKKKLAFMAALSREKPVLMLDEPFNGLDLESNLHMKKIIKHLSEEEGRTILVTSHILESLTSMCDQIHWLWEGKIHHTFSPENYGEIEAKVSEKTDEQHASLFRGKN
ncbi:ABC transporter ATP-binding protein [Flammeovirgaceae bacterium SG7u.111]|nr:ABC transporter ATP-binding protein [Flammeovirgaceae bacterium SG7u.132]WPO35116.1 ABC transporter ATP-binding protein [Flammeovirgaceae bacterium SG7u.111]